MRLLIVDDEISVREHLRLMLRDSGIDLYEAGNGREALELLDRTPIDVMLTDIRMPVVDGLELIKQCKVRHPKLWSIVLSNYAEFHLAQQSLMYGAKNYLLKATITKETLIADLQAAYEERKKQASERVALDANELLMLQNSLFYERLHRLIPTGELLRRADKLQLAAFRRETGPSMYALMEIDRFQEWTEQKFGKQTNLAVFAITNVVREIIKRFDAGNELFHLASARFIVVDSGEADVDAHQRKMGQIQQELQRYLKLDASFLCGYPFAGLDDFFDSIRASEEDFTRFFYSPPACLSVRSSRASVQPDIDLYSFFQSMESEKGEAPAAHRLMLWVDSFFDLLRHLRRNPASVKEDLQVLIAYIEKQGYAVSAEVKWRLERIQAARIDDYKKLFSDWLCGMQGPDAYREEIVKTLQYIHEHYQHKITMDDICSHVNLSRSHLAKLFKSYQGMSVSEYVEHYRMKQARMLLRTTPLSIGNIAEQVGIPDIYYFSKMYKKFYRISPSKDRGTA
jgi:two-component system response regulator YesN